MLKQTSLLGRERLFAAIRKSGLKGDDKDWRTWLGELIDNE